ncbi:LOW QUALITY PROTEIN: CbbBc protein [Phytophthora palmivora]|uniref:CbbBc protein n=1 Tax=Phytophthora palmivora TaxID=4796 RepID=A0A2P4XGG1_9STRA|nr:LOW QUALITY PROTEIN: CbbBc protein [Phytophthora palmivora]
MESHPCRVFRPSVFEHAALVEYGLVMTAFSAEVSAREIETAFEQHGLSRVSVEIRGPRRNYAVLANHTAVEEAIDRFLEAFPNSPRVGNIALRIKKLNNPNN